MFNIFVNLSVIYRKQIYGKKSIRVFLFQKLQKMQKFGIEMEQDLIQFMRVLKVYVVRRGEKISTVFVFLRTKKRDGRSYYNCHENENTYVECTPEKKPF